MGNLYGNPRGGMDLDEAQFKFIAVTMSAGAPLRALRVITLAHRCAQVGCSL